MVFQQAGVAKEVFPGVNEAEPLVFVVYMCLALLLFHLVGAVWL
jgi:hypothetical protein